MTWPNPLQSSHAMAPSFLLVPASVQVAILQESRQVMQSSQNPDELWYIWSQNSCAKRVVQEKVVLIQAGG